MTVIQTGSIAMLSFVLGDYMSRIYSLGPFSPSIYGAAGIITVSYTHLRAHETVLDLVCRLLLEKKKKTKKKKNKKKNKKKKKKK